ncbi:MAG: S8 family peptidase [Candidatus Anammoxibacter sp.]
MDDKHFKYHHILLSNTATTEKFTSPQGGGSSKPKIPERNRRAHHKHLLDQLNTVGRDFQKLIKQRKAIGVAAEVGMALTFKSEPGFELIFESLEFTSSGIELLSVKEVDGCTFASVSVPDGKLKYFINKIERYGKEETSKGKPKNQPLVESISEIRKATLDCLWTDKKDLFPQERESIWWEIWLRAGNNQDSIAVFFRENAHLTGLTLNDEEIRFPDRTVLLAHGTTEQISQSIDLLNCIAELRKAKDTPEIFMGMELKEQREWVNDALKRIVPSSSDETTICILDTGITRMHPLIEPHLSEDDMHAYNISWQNTDHDGHGTEMAGLSLYGDLIELFANNNPVMIPYRLESVKMLPPQGENDPKLYGAITSVCISRAEIEAPHRKRIISMAITTTDFRDRGQPSSWSSAIDKICSGAEDDLKRILIVSAGNTDMSQRHLYANSNQTDGIHDPAQAWNSLCVGAFTEKTYIDAAEYPNWSSIASPGDLSPSSTTSMIWDKQWPLKPDIVFEGGNNAIDPSTDLADDVDSLQLLTTHYRPNQRLLTVSGDTSAATSQIARMAATIQTEYTDLWPETVRALIVHSAEWTPAMLSKWLPLNSKSKVENLLRYCGFGVPNLTHAMRSANNALTLIVQDELQPYEKTEKSYSTRDMHIHTIPWPVEVLEEMDDAEVEMRVTLSYFIEPNPARRGWIRRYGYASHQLRFDVKTPDETVDQFRIRINKAARDEEETSRTSSDSGKWFLGTRLRHKGSLHSDSWKGTAIELAQRGYIGIYPVSGWWKERPQLNRWGRKTRYSLVVSITTPETDVDIYTAVANQIGIEIEV